MSGKGDPKFCGVCGAALAPFVDEGRTRFRCTACSHIVYGNPTPVVAAIVEHRESGAEPAVLLASEPAHVILARGVGWPEKMFGLITGFLEAGETPEAGVLREVKEELGLEGQVASLVGVYAFELRNEIIIAYHVIAEGPVSVGAELEEVKRVPIEKLRPWPFGTGEAVRDWLARRRAAT
jgi:NAD+ diphosphatase